jgi:hypothetical protein
MEEFVMKIGTILLGGSLLVLSMPALSLDTAASESSLAGQASHRPVDVIAYVDSSGKVLNTKTVEKLPPEISKLAYASLKQRKLEGSGVHGLVIPYLVHMQLDAVPRNDGTYDVGLAYLSSEKITRRLPQIEDYCNMDCGASPEPGVIRLH